MKRILTVGLLVALGFAILATILGCESPTAQRERAEAERIRAEAQAYQSKLQAETEAAAERANIRQMERDAAHQRAMEALPYVLAIGGGLLLAGLGGLVFWDLRRQPRPVVSDPALLLMMEQGLEQQRLERLQMWRAIAHLERRTLPDGDNGREVILYTDRRP